MSISGLRMAKAMSRDELAQMLAVVPGQWHLFFWFLVATGVRISEAVALQWRHVALDAPLPHVKVRRAFGKGRMGPPKSRYGRCDIPLDRLPATALHEHHSATRWPGEQDPVFPAANGSPLMPNNVFRRVLQPAREAVNLPWVGFHAFRHTCASILSRKATTPFRSSAGWPSLSRVHARDLCPPARRGPRRAVGNPSFRKVTMMPNWLDSFRRRRYALNSDGLADRTC